MANFDVSKLAYVLLARGILVPKDIDFIAGNMDLETWKQFNNENKDAINGRFVANNMPNMETLPEEETSTAPEVNHSKKPFHSEGNNPIERPDLFND